MSIQIFGLRPYFNETKKNLDLKEKLFPVKAKTVESLFTNIDKIVEEIPEGERYNLFWTAAHCKPGTRVLLEQDILPFDIDDIDTSKLESYVEPISQALSIHPEKCPIVFTGNGIQFIVGLKNKITSEEFFQKNRGAYKKLCEKVDRALEEKGLPGKADPSVFSAARLLRLPLTKNVKPMKYTDMTLLEKHDLKDQRVTTKSATLYTNKLNGSGFELEAHYEPEVIKAETKEKKLVKATYGKPDVAAILEGCNFLKWCQENQNLASEPEWYAALGVTAFFGDNQEATHKISSEYKLYTPEETNIKSEQVQASQRGPTTCAHIKGLWRGKCSECSHHGKIVTPFHIKGKDFIATAECGFTTFEFDPETNKITKLKRHHEDLSKFFSQTRKYKYVGDIDRHELYNGTHWVSTSLSYLRAYAHRNFIPKPDRHLEPQEYANFMMREHFESIDFVKSGSPEGYLNLKNGVLNLVTGKLQPHSPDFRFRYLLKYDYDPKAECPMWEHMLKTITSSAPHLMETLEEYFGYAIVGGRYKYRKALVLSGAGNNGKSTLISALKKVFGIENISSASIEEIKVDKFKAAELDGKLLSLSNEQGPDVFTDSNIFKALTGDDTVNVQRKFENPFDMDNRAKLIMSFNELPYLGDTTYGMLRRFLIIPMNEDILPNHPMWIKDIDQKLALEKAGILNRLLEAYRRLEARGGFLEIEESKALVKEMSRDSDSVLDWFETYVDITGDEEEKFFLGFAFEHFKEEIEFGKSRGQLGFKSFSKRIRKIAISKGLRISPIRIGNKAGPMGITGAKINIDKTYSSIYNKNSANY
jgi:P4 family phage/plasmid primase-like protien